MTKHNQPFNAFTVDLEDWYQGLTSTNPLVDKWPSFESRVVGATQHLLWVLSEHNVTATFFVLGYVADRFPNLIAEIVDAGHEIGVHGYYHRFVYKMSPDEFGHELDRAILAIHKTTGEFPAGHRAPYFSLNANTSWAFEIMASRGLRYDSSVFPVRNMLYGFPGAPRFPYKEENSGIMEFPATTAIFAGQKLPVAGGFYNRVLPFGIIKAGIKQVNNLGQPAILYIHPWELDTGQKYNKVSFRERVTHYYGRGNLEKKLHKLFSDFRFGPLKELMSESLTEQVNTINSMVVTP